MQIDVVIEDPRWEAAGLNAAAQRAGQAVAAHFDLPDNNEVVVMGCDDARIAVLNASFRDKQSATNVLSWPNVDLAADDVGQSPYPPEEPELGDIAIAYETCRREADEQGKPFEAHVVHLLIHAMLHLLGYDHIRDADATLMEAIEVEILGKLGLPDPYRV